jgi:NodT family efflux transporter outer membrane factor (OMF) lipoprotein
VSRVTESRARFGAERANLLPSVSGSVSGQGSRRENRATDVVTRAESYSAGLDASWELDLFGRQFQATKAARADLAQTEESLHNAQASLAAEIATAYVAFRSTQTQLAVVERSLATRTETLQIAAWREQAGLASALDTQQSLSALEQSRASIPSLQLTLEQTRNQLAVLCGKVPGSLDTLLASAGTVPTASGTIAVGIPADTLRQRPDVRAAEKALEAAAARTRAAKLRRLPSLSLSGSIGVDALRAGNLPTPDSSVASLMGNLTAPIFDAGRIRKAIDIQSEQEEQAFISYESAVLTALSDVENALISERRTRERITVLGRATEAAQFAATIAEQQYEAGQADLLTVLDAQRTLLSLQQQKVSTTADLTNAHIQLYKALGGGWSTTL